MSKTNSFWMAVSYLNACYPVQSLFTALNVYDSVKMEMSTCAMKICILGISDYVKSGR